MSQKHHNGCASDGVDHCLEREVFILFLNAYHNSRNSNIRPNEKLSDRRLLLETARPRGKSA